MNARQTSTVGIVAPKYSLAGNNINKIPLANKAPNTCAEMYFGTSFQGNFLA